MPDVPPPPFDDDPPDDAPAADTVHRVAVPSPPPADRLDAWLAEQLPGLSRSRIQALMHEDRVRVDGAPARPRTRLAAGAEVTVHVPPPRPAIPQPEDLPLDVVYEDTAILVVNKPPGLVVHPAPGHADGTLVNRLLHHCTDLAGIGGVHRPGIVHRLDKDTSGLMIVAKHDAAHAALALQFKAGGIHKTYLALVHGHPRPPSGTVDAPIGRHPHDRQRMAVVTRGGKSAVSHYATVASAPAVSLLRVRIETGRTHQIRVHCAHIGHPVVGDARYSRPALDAALPLRPDRQMLHAAILAFAHPLDARPLRFARPPPADMLEQMAAVKIAWNEGLAGES